MKHKENKQWCVIFNPTARGDKAAQFRKNLESVASQVDLKPTYAAGSAITIAEEAVEAGYDTVIAAGGDGTVNEVVNGMAVAKTKNRKIKLGIIPFGTMNVFARELKIPLDFASSWNRIVAHQTREVDLPKATFSVNGKSVEKYFVQIAGAGLDSRAIELMDWKTKKRFGSLAYIVSGLKALGSCPVIKIEADENTFAGKIVLIGNGRLYGGPFEFFPGASLTDGMLSLCMASRLNFSAALRLTRTVILKSIKQSSEFSQIKAKEITLTGSPDSCFQLDGDVVGQLPVKFSVEPKRLRVIV
ncbi:MAG: YegS/Rv2252/BmrU family lipid kinase [Verrucomicrobiales bacterium]|nr:YegS/Rv2252/BmrU family lipid kinase [Verrucomicrobiales bacterium]